MMTEWYVSRRQIWMGRTVYWVSGTNPLVDLALERGLVGEIVRDELGKYEERFNKWRWWQFAPPPRTYRMHWVELTVVDELLGWLLAAWAVWKALLP